MGITNLIKIIRREQSNGKKVVLIHGVFDLLHNGHLYTLEKAKSFGNILVVGIDSDVLVKNTKGAKRPIIKFKERNYLVSALKCVDYTFKVDTELKSENEREIYFEELYSAIKPDILSTGKEDYWTNFQVRMCKKYNIILKIIGESKDSNSTTSIINKILKRYST